ncbi:MAG: hypothetical protein JWP09_562 [Candidatus Taylorbacteria bacterium]|nr:hypothetical protein [Candidatus Taylorbacteria bacterium]
MANPFQEGDEARNKYMEKALHANEEAMGGAKFSDLIDKNSNVYKDPNPAEPRERTPIPEKPTVDSEGYPIIQHVHTYKEDLEGIINSDKLSLSRIAMMQEGANRRTEAPSKAEAEEKKSIIFYIISISLVLIGVGIIGGIYMLTVSKKQAAVQQAAAPKEKYILFSEQNKTVNITKASKSEIGQEIRNIQSGFQDEDSMLEIVPAISDDSGTYRADISTLFSTTNQRAPDELLRTIYPKYFLGLYSKKGKTDPFLLMFTNSYDAAYPALLDWEGFMRDDMSWMFDTNIKTGTTTSALSFKDRVVNNTDARSLEDSTGRVAFFYTFIDPNTILFARNTDTVKKVVDRLREAKFQ